MFQPLGMTRSSFVWQDRFAGDPAWATDWLWRVAPVNRYADGNAAASLVTTAGVARFVAAVLTGRGLSPQTWREFLAPVRETDPGIHIALGIRVEDGPTGRRFFHSGSNGRRFTCYMAGDLGTGIGLVFFTSAYGGTSLVRPLASRVFGDAHPSRNWDWFARHDDPRRLGPQVGSARGGGTWGRRGARTPRRVQASPATRLSFDDILELGAFSVAASTLSLSRCCVGPWRTRRAPPRRTSLWVRRWSRRETSRRRSPRTGGRRHWKAGTERRAGIFAGRRSVRRPAHGG